MNHEIRELTVRTKCRKLRIADILPHMGSGIALDGGEDGGWATSLFIPIDDDGTMDHIVLDSRFKWEGKRVGDLTAEEAQMLRTHAKAICDFLNGKVPEEDRDEEDWANTRE